jgi:hypothetical protein
MHMLEGPPSFVFQENVMNQQVIHDIILFM